MRATYRAVIAVVPALVAAWVTLVPTGTIWAQSLAAGVDHTCTVTAAGGTVCWGSNQYGQIGDGTTILRTTPTNVNLPFGVTALTGNWGHTCAITPSGGAKCWGWNDYGQLGDGSKTQRLTPTDVSGLTFGVTKIAAGYGHTCAIATGGALKCWGADFSPSSNQGQLGNGTNSGSTSPVDVSGLGVGVIAIASGKNHSCAVTAGGGVKCWGANDWDQLGDPGDFNDKNTPGDVATLMSGVSQVSAGEIHSCALTTGGGVKCWGYGSYGALGNGTTPVTSATPVDVTGLGSGVSAISSGKYHNCALATGGNVYCWGDNSSGQIGDGTTTQRNAPVFVASGAIAVAAGSFHTCILTAPGVSQCWGNNAQGNMGSGSQGSPAFSHVDTTYPNSTSTVVTSGTNPAVFGDSVTFTATVTGGVNGVGVRFEADGVTIPGCLYTAISAGGATCATTSLVGGVRNITAVYTGNATTLASQSGAISQTINKADQTIIFDALSDKIDNDPPFTIFASATSGLSVVFASLTNSVCTVAGTTVTILSSGTCSISADQSGNTNFNAGTQVVRNFVVTASGPALALVAVQSRKTHASAGTFDTPINSAVAISGAVSVESRAIGTGHRIVFQYNIPITQAGTATAVDSSLASIGSTSVSVSGNEVIVTLTGIPNNKRVLVSLTNVNGLGQTQSAAVGFLLGDVSNDRSVNVIDVNGVRARSGQQTTISNFRFDFDTSGGINVIDVNAVRSRSGTSLL